MSAHSLPDDSAVFRGVFDAYPDGVLLVDAQGRIVLANAAVTQLLGYPPSSLEGLSVDTLVPDSVAPRHAAHRRSFALAPKTRPMGTDLELMAKRADGSEVMVEIALSPLRMGGGDTAMSYVVASIRGIAEYPRVKRAMQRAHYNEYLILLGRVAVDTLDHDELLQRMPAIVREALAAESVSVMLLTPNQRELRMASYSGAHADRADLLAYPNRADLAAAHVVAQGAPLVVGDFAREDRFDVPAHLREAGPMSGVAMPLIDRGKVFGVLGAWSGQLSQFGDDEVAFLEALATLLSTTLQRAQAEAQARHAQRLETVGQLTGGVAHDFNNLLMVIQGNLQMLADQPAVRDDAPLRQMVAAASRASQRGAELTDKLLTFARRQALEPEPVDPIALLHALADMLRRTLGENIRVAVHAPATCPRCLVDAVQLESALLNVAVNARDAMPRGGDLVLRCGAGQPRQDENVDSRSGALAADRGDGPATQEWVWLSVQDNGSGMSEDVRDRAFEPFFTTKEPGRGTGLGLSTVYGFLKQSRGYVELASAPGAGTTVTMFLPAMNGDDGASGAAGARVDVAVPPGLRVLLVEDDPEVRNVAETFLKSMKCKVVACASAEAALVKLGKDSKFSLLFSDIMLGAGMDGHALAQRVTTQYPDMPILLTSGYSRPQAAYSVSGVDLRVPTLRKPYSREALAQAIAQCLLEYAG